MSAAEVVVLLCWAVFLVYSIVLMFAVKTDTSLELSDRSSRIPWLTILAAGFILYPFLRGLIPFDQEVFGLHLPSLDFGAAALAACGLVVSIWSRAALGKNWSTSPSLRENHELVEWGPYAYIRHPIYSGFLLLLIGTVLYFRSLFCLVIAGIALICFTLRAETEEQLLERYFPDSYPVYKKRTKKFIPFLF